jgi:alpha-D-xyloside xylohydrolase
MLVGEPPHDNSWKYEKIPGGHRYTSAAFLDDFRRADEMKYRLMPYIYAKAKDSTERGLPMVRALFI